MPDAPPPRRHTDDHGAPGLRHKFSVYKTSDRDYIEGEEHVYVPEALVGADGEFVFVLRPETDAAACAALRAYAVAVSGRDTLLARQLRDELRRIAADNRAG